MADLVLLAAILLVSSATCQRFEGQACVQIGSGRHGACTLLKNCRPAKRRLMEGNYPRTCSFHGAEPVVCCEPALHHTLVSNRIDPRLAEPVSSYNDHFGHNDSTHSRADPTSSRDDLTPSQTDYIPSEADPISNWVGVTSSAIKFKSTISTNRADLTSEPSRAARSLNIGRINPSLVRGWIYLILNLSPSGANSPFPSGANSPLSLSGANSTIPSGANSPLSPSRTNSTFLSGANSPLSPSGTNSTFPSGVNSPLSPSGANSTFPSGANSPLSPSGANSTFPSGANSPLSPSGTNSTFPSGASSPLSPSGTNSTFPSGANSPLSPSETNSTFPSGANFPLSDSGTNSTVLPIGADSTATPSEIDSSSGPEQLQKCPPVPENAVKVQKTGQKAWDKCIELAQYAYPCEPSDLSNSTLIRKETCNQVTGARRPNSRRLIEGGMPAREGEFPHMTLLGFGELTNIMWACGGTLVSERWVLTAGHCTFKRDTEEDVEHARLGGDSSKSPLDMAKHFTIITIITEPGYSPSSVYNDIALLQLDRTVIFSTLIHPACLHTGQPINDEKIIATGWGTTKPREDYMSSDLQKVVLEKFSYFDCARKNPATRRAYEGIRDTTQLCAGHWTEAKDTCQGDSGGPLQLINSDMVFCTYLVIGVTSYGKSCGVLGQPSPYTRVSAFIPWIESVVWP